MADEYSFPPLQRRKGPDLIIKMLNVLSAILWFFTFINFEVVLSARPQDETLFDRFFHITVRDFWDYRLLRVALILSIIQFIVGLISLYLNSRRLKRKNDKIRVSIIISLFASLALSIFLMFVVW